MSLGNILAIARTALVAHQRAASTASHNLANVATEGFSRQRVTMKTAVPQQTPYGWLGRGIDGGQISRVRDQFVDIRFRAQNGDFGESTTMRDMLSDVESLFSEPGPAGIASSLNAFYNAWSDLANDPSSATTRNIVRQSASTLVARVRSLDTRLDEAAQNAGTRLGEAVDQINSLARQITDLNRQVLAASTAGGSPDLQDRLDFAIDKLSELVEARALPNPDGTMRVLVGGNLFADVAGFQQVERYTTGPSAYNIRLVGSGTPLNVSGGTVKALADFTNVQVPTIRQDLDRLAAAIVTEVNAIHRTGVVNVNDPVTGAPTGTATNRDFFDPSGVTAGTLAIDPAVLASLDAIATGTTSYTPAPPAPAVPRAVPGDGSVALRLAQLRTTNAPSLPGGNTTISEFYQRIVGDLATETGFATESAKAAAQLRDAVEQQRQSESGVSTDEELIVLMQTQQAYQAAARVVNVADEMLQAMLDMVR